MLAEKKRRVLLSVVLAALVLNVTVGIIHNFRIKKLLSGKEESIELSIDVYDEVDTDDGWLLDYVAVPAGVSLLSLIFKSPANTFYTTEQCYKQLSEERLYILFHQLKLHIG